MQICDPVSELSDLSALEHMLICQIIPFMFLVSRQKGAQHGLKGQVVLVPTDLKRITQALPRSCNDSHLITIALKRRLSDKGAYKEQHIRPAVVNKALDYLIRTNHLYSNVRISNDWETISKSTDPELWDLLTKDDTDFVVHNSDDENSDSLLERQTEQIHKEGAPNPTVMHDIDGASVSIDKIIDVAPGEGHIPVSLHVEPDCEALAFPRHFPDGKFHFNYTREKPLSISKYIHARLKCCDSRFASDPQYIFFMLDLLEREALSNAINFSERKCKQSSITVGQLRNPDSLKRLISDDELYAIFKNIRGTPQYYDNMKYDVFSKIRYLNVQTFFLTMSVDQCWNVIIKIVARQYGEDLTDDQIDNMNWSTKVTYLKRNPVTVARQIDYILKKVWTDVIMSGIHPIGQILNFDERGEFQSQTGNKHVHAAIHIKDAPKLDQETDQEVIQFIDNHITTEMPDENEYPDFNELVKRVQSHHHTQSCRKKKGVNCRFYFPCPPSTQTLISRSNVNAKKLRKARRIVDKVIRAIGTVEDITLVTETELLDIAGVTREEYYKSLARFRRKTNVVYKRRPSDINISPYNTVILACLRANMNIQYVVGVYGLVAYLTSYLCKPEHNMSEFMKAAAAERHSSGVKDKLRAIGNVFLTKREVSCHEAVMRCLSMSLRRSNMDVIYIPTGESKNRTRVLKSQIQLDVMEADDENVFAMNIMDRYTKRPDVLENMCYAEFASNYKLTSIENAKVDDDDTLQGVLNSASGYVDIPESPIIIKLKDECGYMRKRSRPCVIRWHSVSKQKSLELYALRLLQLYLPWRNEDELRHMDGSYASKFEDVKHLIEDTIKVYEPFDDITPEDLEDAYYSSEDTSDDDSVDSEDELSIFNPDLLEFSSDADTDTILTAAVSNNSTHDLSMPDDQFYSIVNCLNDGQRNLFNFICRHTQKILHYESNGLESPRPFHIYLSGGGGVGKSYLVIACIEYMKRRLKYPGQNLDEPSIAVTASTGVAASRISGTTLHSSFGLPIYGLGIQRAKTLTDKKLHDFQQKFKHLKVLIIDEISMIGDKSNYDLNKHLQLIMKNDTVYGGVSIFTVGDLLQLPPVKQHPIYSDKRSNYTSLAPHLWKDNFEIYELTEQVRQIEDPLFAELVNRVRTGEQTPDDLEILKAMENTDTQNWPKHHVKLFLTNHLVKNVNDSELNLIESDKIVIHAKDSLKDEVTKRCPVSIPENLAVSQTAGLLKVLTVCVGARVMLTANLDVSDHLVNGSTGTIVHLHLSKRNPLNGKIYVKFDLPKAGSKMKSNKIPHLKECVPISAKNLDFTMETKNGKSTIKVWRTQYPLVIAHALTIHKSQGGTFKYVEANFDQSTKSNNPSKKAPVEQGSFYTTLSRVTTQDGLKLVNFHEDHIRVNEAALHEIARMRKERPLNVAHPVNSLSGEILALWNIRRSWKKKLENFLSHSVHLNCCSILCFTETGLDNDPDFDVSLVSDKWKSVFKHTEHGLALCYNTERIELIKEYPTVDAIEILACHLRADSEVGDFILIVVYRKPGNVGDFFSDLSHELRRLPTGLRTIIVGDFNYDQRLQENVDFVNLFFRDYNLVQNTQYSTHNDGGILDLIFDVKSNTVVWQPTPFSDHFILYYQL